ncbi:MAG: prepilin-type N-terminal cleavage/methylation domain-containing protein [Candidatus Thiodiazotropha sp.]
MKGLNSPADARNSASGFTLLELIISLVLMSLIVMLLFSGLDLGRRAWEKTASAGERQTQERLTFDYLRRTLGALMPEQIDTEEGPLPLFRGESSAIRWVGPSASQAGIGGAALFQLELRDRGAEKVLLLKRWLYHPEVLAESPKDGLDWRQFESGQWQPRDRQVAELRYSEHLLMEGLRGLELNYYGSSQPGLPEEWQREWRDSRRVPRLIRLRVLYPEGDSPAVTFAIGDAR